MTLGIGLYAPCMILVALLGMNPQGRVPDHDGLLRVPDAGRRACASSAQGSYSLGPSLGLTLGGIPAVLVAAFVVKSLPLTALRWLVVAVVAYAAVGDAAVGAGGAGASHGRGHRQRRRRRHLLRHPAVVGAALAAADQRFRRGGPCGRPRAGTKPPLRMRVASREQVQRRVLRGSFTASSAAKRIPSWRKWREAEATSRATSSSPATRK